MTFFNSFSNLNMNCFCGMNNTFSPMFSCFNMPTFSNINIFNSFDNFFSSFNIPEIFTNSFTPTFNSLTPKPMLGSTSTFTPAPKSAPMPMSLDFSNTFNNNFVSNSQSLFPVKPTSSVGDSFTFNNRNKKTFSLSNYNAKAGETLARNALNSSVGWTGYCARYVKNAIQKSGLGSYQAGHAYQMTGLLRNNKNFKEISPLEYDVKSLPAGCVLVYNKGSQGYSPKYGHTEITTGDGRAVSDGITRNLQRPDAIFVPVMA